MKGIGMRVIYFYLCALLGIAHANQYDYLLFSNVLSDVKSGFDLKANVNARWQGSTPLYTAVKNNNLEIAYMLITAGADVNAVNNGETALHLAVRNKNLYLVELLVIAGAKVNVQDERYGNTPLHYAAYNSDTQSLNILINAKGDTRIKNFDGMTPAQIVMTEITIPPIIIEDDNIAISASAFKIANGAVIFNIRNLTNAPLTIFNTSLYINGMLISSNQRPLVIPAGTTITNTNTMQIGMNGIYALKMDKNAQVDIKAGFSIDYQAEGKMANVFNSASMKLQLWNPPPANQVKSASSQDSMQDSKR